MNERRKIQSQSLPRPKREPQPPRKDGILIISKKVDLDNQQLPKTFDLARSFGEPRIGLVRRQVATSHSNALSRSTRLDPTIDSERSDLDVRTASVKISPFEKHFQETCLEFHSVIKELFIAVSTDTSLDYRSVEEFDRSLQNTLNALDAEKDFPDRKKVENNLSVSQFIPARTKLILGAMDPIDRTEFTRKLMDARFFRTEISALEQLIFRAIDLGDKSALNRIEKGLRSRDLSKLDDILEKIEIARHQPTSPDSDPSAIEADQKQKLLQLLKDKWIPSQIIDEIVTAAFDQVIGHDLDFGSAKSEAIIEHYRSLNTDYTFELCSCFQTRRPQAQIMAFYQYQLEVARTEVFFQLVTGTTTCESLPENEAVKKTQEALESAKSQKRSDTEIQAAAAEHFQATANLRIAASSMLIDLGLLSSPLLSSVQEALQAYNNAKPGSAKKKAEDELLQKWDEFKKSVADRNWGFMLQSLDAHSAVRKITEVIYSKTLRVIDELIALKVIRSYMPSNNSLIKSSILKAALSLLDESRCKQIVSQFSYPILITLLASPRLFKPNERVIKEEALQSVHEQVESQIEKLESQLNSNFASEKSLAYYIGEIEATLKYLTITIGDILYTIATELKERGVTDPKKKEYKQQLIRWVSKESPENGLNVAIKDLFTYLETCRIVLNARRRLQARIKSLSTNKTEAPVGQSEKSLEPIDDLTVAQEIMLHPWLSTGQYSQSEEKKLLAELTGYSETSRAFTPEQKALLKGVLMLSHLSRRPTDPDIASQFKLTAEIARQEVARGRNVTAWKETAHFLNIEHGIVDETKRYLELMTPEILLENRLQKDYPLRYPSPSRLQIPIEHNLDI